MIDESIQLGVIGGSGLYSMPGLDNSQTIDLDTPFGKPSAPFVIGELSGKRVAFLARHGIGHTISPSEINYQANIYAFKMLGVPRIISISACGSLREDYVPGNVVIPDQLFDFTRGPRKRTFFGDGLVAHIGCADPFCHELGKQIGDAAQSAGATVRMGGTLITIEGPRFSTRAESNTFRSWGMSIIGMTASPEVFLAREAEICYATMAHVTDYDVWHTNKAPVTVEMVVQVLNHNTEIAQQAIRILMATLEPERNCDCQNALKDALITAPERIPTQTKEKLKLLIQKYISQ